MATQTSHKDHHQFHGHSPVSKKRKAPTSSGGSDLLQMVEGSLNDIRELIECRICVHPMYEPYTTDCGHTFCYGCLVKWFEQDRTKKSCPDCRATVTRQPVPSYVLRDVAQIFSTRAELLPAGENTEEHKKWQEEERQKVELHRLSSRGLFPGVFNRQNAIRDGQDRVLRCPNCTWELEDGSCNACGWSDMSDDGQFSDDFSPSEDEQRSLNEMLQPMHGWPQPELMDGFHVPNLGPALNHGSTFGDTDDEEEADDSAGSLEEFVVNEDDTPTEFDTSYFGPHFRLPFASDTNSNASDTVYTIDSDEDHRSREETESLYGGETGQQHIGLAQENFDSEPIPTRRRPNDAAGARRVPSIVRNQPRMTGSLRPVRLSRPGNQQLRSIQHTARTRIRSPVTISIDSDTDDFPLPPQRPSRRPRIRRQILSDDDEVPRFHSSSSDDEGNNLRSGATATVGDQSPPRFSTINPPEVKQNSSAMTPILVDSSPVRPPNHDVFQREREQSIPGAFPPSFSYSEPSQAVRPGIASPTPSESTSNMLPLSPRQQFSPVSPFSPFTIEAHNDNAPQQHRDPPTEAFSLSLQPCHPPRSWTSQPTNVGMLSPRPARVPSVGSSNSRAGADREKEARKAERKRQKRQRRQREVARASLTTSVIPPSRNTPRRL